MLEAYWPRWDGILTGRHAASDNEHKGLIHENMKHKSNIYEKSEKE